MEQANKALAEAIMNDDIEIGGALVSPELKRIIDGIRRDIEWRNERGLWPTTRCDEAAIVYAVRRKERHRVA